MRYLLCLLIAFTALLIAPLAHAQLDELQNSDKPLEVTAQQTLEWHRNDKKYIARGDAIVKQGDMEIHADTITADYRETDASAFDIYLLTATGNVEIYYRDNKGYGDELVYDVQKGLALMTGNNLKLMTANETLRADDRFEYWVYKGQLIARKNAYVTNGKDNIAADKMEAHLKEDSQGKRQLKKLAAMGSVVITTPEEILQGDKGEYNAETNIAQLTGDVSIKRGPNVLHGEKAEVDLNTNISRMFGGPKEENGRVRGVFYPNSGKLELE